MTGCRCLQTTHVFVLARQVENNGDTILHSVCTYDEFISSNRTNTFVPAVDWMVLGGRMEAGGASTGCDCNGYPNPRVLWGSVGRWQMMGEVGWFFARLRRPVIAFFYPVMYPIFIYCAIMRCSRCCCTAVLCYVLCVMCCYLCWQKRVCLYIA